jgi:3-keto-disaccharide hydrolase
MRSFLTRSSNGLGPGGAVAFLLVAFVASVAGTGARTGPRTAQAAGTWKPLFNGTDLTGWMAAPGRGGGANAGAASASAPVTPAWKVENGVLVGGQAPPGTRTGGLQTVDQYKDFELELDFMLAEHGTQCSAELIGPEQANASAEKSCLYNSGINMRTGYQVNLGRREAGEFIGVVVHRVAPEAIRRNVLWLDKGDEKFPTLRKKGDWNHLQISFKGPHLQVHLNGQKICDVTDNPTDPAEAKWKEAGPIGLQWPPASEGGGFDGYVKYRNIRIR